MIEAVHRTFTFYRDNGHKAEVSATSSLVRVRDLDPCELGSEVYGIKQVDDVVTRVALVLGVEPGEDDDYDRVAAEVAALLLPAAEPEPVLRLVGPMRSVPIVGGTESGPWCSCGDDPDAHCPVHGMTRPGMNTPRPPELT